MEAVTGGHRAVDRCRACLEGMTMGGRCCSFPHQGNQGSEDGNLSQSLSEDPGALPIRQSVPLFNPHASVQIRW